MPNEHYLKKFLCAFVMSASASFLWQYPLIIASVSLNIIFLLYTFQK